MTSQRLFVVFLMVVCLVSAAAADDIKILVNHIGYEPAGAKRAVIRGGPEDQLDGFKVIDAETGKVVLSGVPAPVGPVRKWKDWRFWTVDFSAVAQEGRYRIECSSPGGTVRSSPFLVQKNVLERSALSDVVYYFKSQRSSGRLDQADRSMKIEGKEGVTVDVHGGWYDATGDYGKHLSHLSYSTYFNPQQIPLTVWSLLASHRELSRRGDPYFQQYLRRLQDEGLFGADFLVRMKNPSGSFYITVSGRGPEKKPEDRLITAKATRHIILTPETKDKFRDYGKTKITDQASYEAGYREGGGIAIAALALAASLGVSGDFAPADYLRAAEDAFSFLEENNLLFTNDGRENIVDDYCALMAATELFRATKADKYKEAADKRARNLMTRLTTHGQYKDYWRADDGDRPFFHPADAGLPLVSLMNYFETADAALKEEIRDAVRRSMTFELAVTAEVSNPFGYGRQLVQSGKGVRRTSFFFPHDTETAPWWQGENARLGSLAAAARLASRIFSDDREFQFGVKVFAQDQLNWILGLNPFDSCMLYGRGRNNPEYMFFDSYEYMNAPGGISNGITAGYTDEEDIDYNLHFAVTGKDDDWRWTEQWLPHASWFLFAVALGDD
ncbi:MAG TPA: glycoside hydrolase family 9 protein [Candidatus Desulfaltia sp.]|nr:glycoside hydrolase family 9 protein [Candidatus Desulfaltia sp.]